MAWSFKMNMQLPQGRLGFVEKWPMMNSNEVIFILATYLLFILKIGPAWMEKRRPFQMRKLLFIFNALKVLNSSILAFKFLSYIMEHGLFPRQCEHDQLTIYTIAALYWKYMITKFWDLFDTVIFVLRKKYSQVTFLHVYHHVFMVIISYSCLKYDPSDHWAFMAVMNCSIHAVMYTYYGLAALGPAYEKYLWWKKYVTIMQLVQFILVIAHVIVQTYTSECPMQAASYWLGLSNLGLFVCLFADFYKKRYMIKNKDQIGFACTKQCIE